MDETYTHDDKTKVCEKLHNQQSSYDALTSMTDGEQLLIHTGLACTQEDPIVSVQSPQLSHPQGFHMPNVNLIVYNLTDCTKGAPNVNRLGPVKDYFIACILLAHTLTC